jgi:chromosome segregation ATPase
MSGGDAPNLDDGRFTSKDAGDARDRQLEECAALLPILKQITREIEEVDAQKKRLAEKKKRLAEKKESLLAELSGLLFEAEDAADDAEKAEFAAKILKDIEALPVRPDERRGDGP